MSDTIVFYIHGFGSSVESDTLKSLSAHFPDIVGLTYDHNDPSGSLVDMIEQIELMSGDRDVVIIGSSLGGWYGEQLTPYIVGQYIFYNPSIDPSTSLRKYGVPQSTLDEYSDFSTHVRADVPRTIFVCLDDTVIDPIPTKIKYQYRGKIVSCLGGHRMTPHNIKLVADRVNYLRNQLP